MKFLISVYAAAIIVALSVADEGADNKLETEPLAVINELPVTAAANCVPQFLPCWAYCSKQGILAAKCVKSAACSSGCECSCLQSRRNLWWDPFCIGYRCRIPL